MSDAIIWYCTADDSWGGCSERDLIIIRESDMTDEERAAFMDADDIWGVVSSAYDRINGGMVS